MIFLLLHPLNYLHAWNVLIGILFLKASIVDFPKKMKMISGVLGLSPHRHRSCDALTAHACAGKWLLDGAPTLRLTNPSLIHCPSNKLLTVSTFTPTHLRYLSWSPLWINLTIYWTRLVVLIVLTKNKKQTKTLAAKMKVLAWGMGKAAMKRNV